MNVLIILVMGSVFVGCSSTQELRDKFLLSDLKKDKCTSLNNIN